MPVLITRSVESKGGNVFKLASVGTLAASIALLSQTDKTNDEHSVEVLVSQFTDAWNHHDAKGFAAAFSEDADFTNWRGEGGAGRAKTEELHASMFATVFSKSHQESTDIKTRFIRPDITAVDVHWKMTGVLDRQGNPRPDREGLLSFVIAKNSGRWQIVVMQNLDISALPPPPK